MSAERGSDKGRGEIKTTNLSQENFYAEQSTVEVSSIGIYPAEIPSLEISAEDLHNNFCNLIQIFKSCNLDQSAYLKTTTNITKMH